MVHVASGDSGMANPKTLPVTAHPPGMSLTHGDAYMEGCAGRSRWKPRPACVSGRCCQAGAPV